MALSRRVRFEILRRDDYTCRYCGSSAPDVKLTVDHVIPVALGGGDDPTNLVTACQPCNAGKASTSPDEKIVADVDENAERLRAALLDISEIRRKEIQGMRMIWDDFDEFWNQWTCGPEMLKVPRDEDWRQSIERFILSNLEPEELLHYAELAMRRKLPASDKWKYFCGVCWKTIRERQETALKMVREGNV